MNAFSQNPSPNFHVGWTILSQKNVRVVNPEIPQAGFFEGSMAAECAIGDKVQTAHSALRFQVAFNVAL